MQLDDVLRGADALLYMERYVDEGAKTYSRVAARSEASRRYRPDSRAPSFDLITVRAPKRDVAIFQADPRRELLDRYVQPDEVLFAVHPETWASAEDDHLEALRALPRGTSLEVAPTASTRTVLTRDASDKVPPHFLKLHYPRRISRFHRRLRRKNIRTSIEVTRDLATIPLERFAYLPDTLGVVSGHADDAWGFLVREIVPRPICDGRSLIPFFALYAGDLEHPCELPLLVQLIDRLEVDPRSFALEQLMLPVLECWAHVVRKRGILLESHAQNVLLEVDRDLHPTRIVHRDFDVWTDAETRARAGLDMPFSGTSIGTDTAYGRGPHYSLNYDHFLGHELFDYVLACLVRFYGVDAAEIRAHVAAAFHRVFADADAFFPRDTTYYFSDEILPGNAFRLERTGRPPEWR